MQYIPIGERKSPEKLNEKNIILHAKTVNLSNKKKTVKKLHSQFSHPTPDKLKKLISNAGLAEDEDLIANINKISKECQICRVYKRPFLKPIVATPLHELHVKVLLSHTETVYTFCMRKLYKMYKTDLYKMYAECIPYFDKFLYTFCIQNQKNYAS